MRTYFCCSPGDSLPVVFDEACVWAAGTLLCVLHTLVVAVRSLARSVDASVVGRRGYVVYVERVLGLGRVAAGGSPVERVKR